MEIRVAVPKESEPEEHRVALVPEVVTKLTKLGFEVTLEKGAGLAAHYSDTQYEKAGAKIVTDSQILFQDAQVILKVQFPSESEIEKIPEKTILISFIFAHRHASQVLALKNKKITSFAMELIPRVTRAQSMDALSSQSTVAGYKAVLLAADTSRRFFPMLTTAAGTIRPAKVLILGAGVAGLQAIATARRLGAIVEAYDVRRTTKEQVESLGARFLETPFNAEGEGGYARELTEVEKKQEQEMIAQHVSEADVLITTAQIPGRPAPRLISEAMVDRMKAGSVIVDLAAEGGGNCALTQPGKTVEVKGVTIVGTLNLPSLLPTHASEMYAKNLYQFLILLTKNGTSLELDLSDEIIAGSLLTHEGVIRR